jgi:hypothetical protein
MSVDLLDRHQVRTVLTMPADLGTVLLDDDVADPLEAERAQGLALVGLAADARTFWVTLSVPSAGPPRLRPGRSRAAGATSSSGRPRGPRRPRALEPFSAATVACTMLIWLDEPSDLLSTSWMPAHSSTARTGPPAMTPVPGRPA